MLSTAAEVISALQLAPLPREGGWFRQTWRSEAGSAILFLITPENFSALHRLTLDEVWHFHAGDPVEHVQLDPRSDAGRAEIMLTPLGPDIARGETPQLVVPAGVWQGARVAPASRAAASPRQGWSLLGCTLAPPWREDALELGARAELLRRFPAAAAHVLALTR
jgi:predicted cupin superfamily sugar epimerase